MINLSFKQVNLPLQDSIKKKPLLKLQLKLKLKRLKFNLKKFKEKPGGIRNISIPTVYLKSVFPSPFFACLPNWKKIKGENSFLNGGGDNIIYFSSCLNTGFLRHFTLFCGQSGNFQTCYFKQLSQACFCGHVFQSPCTSIER